MLSLTERSAQASFLCLFWAIERINAHASFVILSLITLVVSLPPPASTGCAAPILVPCAIIAKFAESVMNTPAEPALAPPGATYTMIGTFEPSMSLTMSRSEEHTSELQSLTNLVCRLLLAERRLKFKQARCPFAHRYLDTLRTEMRAM